MRESLKNFGLVGGLLHICDGSVLRRCGGINPALTFNALGLRLADRSDAMAKRGDL